MEKTRRQFSPQGKVAILREHVIEQVPVSDLRDKHKLTSDALSEAAAPFSKRAFCHW
jgi:hypothetical protein